MSVSDLSNGQIYHLQCCHELTQWISGVSQMHYLTSQTKGKKKKYTINVTRLPLACRGCYTTTDQAGILIPDSSLILENGTVHVFRISSRPDNRAEPFSQLIPIIRYAQAGEEKSIAAEISALWLCSITSCKCGMVPNPFNSKASYWLLFSANSV